MPLPARAPPRPRPPPTSFTFRESAGLPGPSLGREGSQWLLLLLGKLRRLGQQNQGLALAASWCPPSRRREGPLHLRVLLPSQVSGFGLRRIPPRGSTVPDPAGEELVLQLLSHPIRRVAFRVPSNLVSRAPPCLVPLQHQVQGHRLSKGALPQAFAQVGTLSQEHLRFLPSKPPTSPRAEQGWGGAFIPPCVVA